MPYVEAGPRRSKEQIDEKNKENQEITYERQAEHLGQYKPSQENEETGPTQAVEAKFITPLDPVIETGDGGRLPVIPVEEAVKLNRLKDEAEGRKPRTPLANGAGAKKYGGLYRDRALSSESQQSYEADAPLLEAAAPSR